MKISQIELDVWDNAKDSVLFVLKYTHTLPMKAQNQALAIPRDVIRDVVAVIERSIGGDRSDAYWRVPDELQG